MPGAIPAEVTTRPASTNRHSDRTTGSGVSLPEQVEGPVVCRRLPPVQESGQGAACRGPRVVPTGRARVRERRARAGASRAAGHCISASRPPPAESRIGGRARDRGPVRNRLDFAMRNKTYAKLLCHNLSCVIQSQCELGIEPVFWKGETRDLAV
jgi:hypothetical protein